MAGTATLGAVAVAALAVVYYMYLSGESGPPTLPDRESLPADFPFKIRGPVRAVEWNSENFQEELVESFEPAVIRGSPAKNWPALSLWNRQLFTQHNMTLEGVYKSKQRHFLYFNLQQKLKDHIGWKKPFGTFDMSAEKFFDRISDPNDANYYYFSTDIPAGIPDSMAADVAPSNFFTIANETKKSMNLWIGEEGVVATPHYDVWDNFFTQIRGRKRFTLFPPSEWRNLYLFSKLHPSYRQSPVDPAHPDYTTFPDYKKAKGYQVELHAGEVLYIPPFWFHYVETLEDSIGVNTWYPCKAGDIIAAARTAPSPLVSYRHPYPVAEYLKMLLAEMYPSQREGKVIKDFLKRRWLHFMDKDTLKDYDKSLCSCEGPEGDKSRCGSTEDSMMKARLHREGVSVVASYARQLPASVVDIFIADYLDETAEWIAGTKDAGAFLYTCVR